SMNRHLTTSSILVLLSLQYTNAYIQSTVCPQCAGVNSQYGSGSYNGYTNIDSNPLSYFNGPTDFGSQLGKAIATRINEVSSTDNSGRLTFGSYPTSSFTNQGFGGQNYVVQPDLYQQALSGYGTQGLGGYPSMSFSSFPNYGFGTGQQSMQNMLPGTSGYSFGNFNNLGASTYGTNSYGNYGSYGIPDPITTAGSAGGSCPYCFGNKGGFKTKKAKRASSKEKN
uniref:Secreted protein n=1 Tax=Haemonchus contortus TaxID=6289 RepID=A0A7I4Y8A4_HAECO